MRKAIDNSAVPRGGKWTWVCPETGYKIQHPYFNQTKIFVRQYLIANHFPISANFDDDFDENVCSHADPNTCAEFVPPTLLQKMSTLSRALYTAANDWRKPVVSAEEVERRRDICQTCNYFGGSRSPIKIACRKCGCSGLALYLPSKHCPLENPKW